MGNTNGFQSLEPTEKMLNASNYEKNVLINIFENMKNTFTDNKKEELNRIIKLKYQNVDFQELYKKSDKLLNDELYEKIILINVFINKLNKNLEKITYNNVKVENYKIFKKHHEFFQVFSFIFFPIIGKYRNQIYELVPELILAPEPEPEPEPEPLPEHVANQITDILNN